MRRLVATALLLFTFLSYIPSAFAAQSWESVSERVLQSIGRVTMNVLAEDMPPAAIQSGDCTAFSINRAKHFYATAAHCNGVDVRIEGHATGVVYLDETKDLMVLQAPLLDQPALKLATKQLRMGQPVAAYGYAYGWPQPSLKNGLVSIPKFASGQFGNRLLTIFNFSFIQGMSGGPVVDADGRVVGIVQQTNVDRQASLGANLQVLTEQLGIYFE